MNGGNELWLSDISALKHDFTIMLNWYSCKYIDSLKQSFGFKNNELRQTKDDVTFVTFLTTKVNAQQPKLL